MEDKVQELKLGHFISEQADASFGTKLKLGFILR
jgi:hypothetical protein